MIFVSDNKNENDKEIDKLYDLIPKLIGHIIEGNAERHAALDKLLQNFSKINKIESAVSAQHTPISLSRIYELATAGGGDGDLEQLKLANQAFADENQALALAVESLTFKLSQSRKQSVDEFIEAGRLKLVSVEGVKNSVEAINKAVEKLNNSLNLLTTANGSEESGQSLDVKFLSAIEGLDDISLELLNAVPKQTTFLGRVLRRYGFAYDYKDMASARVLIASVLKVNKQLSQTIVDLSTAQEQSAQLLDILNVLNDIVTHEDRQGEDYKQAMAEVARLDHKINTLESQCGTIEERETEIEQKNEELQKIKQDIEAAGQETLEAKNAKIKALEEEIEEAKKETIHLKDTIEKLDESEPLQKIWQLTDEVANLGYSLRRSENECARQAALREAFESRIEIWIKNSERLGEENENLKDKLSRKWLFNAAAGVGMVGVGALGGYGLQSLFANSPGLALIVGALVLPTTVGALLGAFEERGERLKGALIVGGAGLVVSGVCLVSSMGALTVWDKDTTSQLKDKILKECPKDVPCLFERNKDDGFKIMPISDYYKGRVVTHDFSDPKKPVIKVKGSILNKPKP